MAELVMLFKFCNLLFNIFCTVLGGLLFYYFPCAKELIFQCNVVFELCFLFVICVLYSYLQIMLFPSYIPRVCQVSVLDILALSDFLLCFLCHCLLGFCLVLHSLSNLIVFFFVFFPCLCIFSVLKSSVYLTFLSQFGSFSPVYLCGKCLMFHWTCSMLK